MYLSGQDSQLIDPLTYFLFFLFLYISSLILKSMNETIKPPLKCQLILQYTDKDSMLFPGELFYSNVTSTEDTKCQTQ